MSKKQLPILAFSSYLRKRRPKLLAITGAGLEEFGTFDNPRTLKHPAELRSNAPPELPVPFDDGNFHVWDIYEAARITSLVVPAPEPIYILGQLARAKIIRGIVNLNYTMYIEQAISYDGSALIVRNPILKKYQHDPEGYFSASQPSDPRAISLYTPHGSFGFATYLEGWSDKPAYHKPREWCDPHVFRRPPFPISNRACAPTAYLTKKVSLMQMHDHKLARKDSVPIRADEAHLTTHLVHYIDWHDPSGSNRQAFRSEVNGSKDAIERAHKRKHCVCLFGFTGTRIPFDNTSGKVEHNEELVPTLLRDLTNTWAIVTADQHQQIIKNPSAKPVLSRLEKASHVIVVNSEDELSSAMRIVAQSLGVSLTTNDYVNWKLQWFRH